MSPPSPSPDRPSAPPPVSHPILWPDAEREAAFLRWLQALAAPQQLDATTLRPASADASFRRYFRVDSAAGTRIIMDAPPDKENCRPFVQVDELMTQAGLNVPRVLAWDEAQGFMLLSDLGGQTMMQAMDKDRASANLPLYLKAVDALVRWQQASRPDVLPPYDTALLRRELELFPEWYLARHRGVAVEWKLRETLDRMFALIIERNLGWPAVYVHRDFMPRNLMIPGDLAEQRLGVLDFQDAVYGPITYDIASLMRDAFLTWEEDFVLDVTIRYWQQARDAGLPVGDDFGEFYRGVEWMGLQRHLKVAGIFARLTLRDGKPHYLADAPRFIAYIRATCSRYIELKPLLRLVDEVEGITEMGGYAFGRV
ncbi:MAG: phosphotransferase [Gammaproteobacteria bacterium]|nr:phosphotransferase [Gammaproteobacteria bacterium]